jgi:hypothetical protein
MHPNQLTGSIALCVSLLLGLALADTNLRAEEPAATSFAAEDLDFFETRIRPILADHCLDCHSADEDAREANLSLSSREAILRGGDSGPAATARDPDSSLIMQKLTCEDRTEAMPPDGRLEDAVIADFRRWIEMGLPDPRTENSPTNASSKNTSEDAEQQHWAFQPLQMPAIPPELPATVGSSWAQSDLDRLAATAMHRAGLTPSPAAEANVLLRRLYIDLIGLPPTYEEAQQFLMDPSSNAYEQVVERLLASPHFGERWARHWLDVARYADTKGYVFQEDRNYPQAYTYRDWVIKAFNQDMPYDHFLICQLAADQLPESERLAALPAMGYLTLGRRFINNKHDIINDRIDVVSRGMLGLTVSCARCHDHKYDPIPTDDYYSLYGVFANSHEPKDEPCPLRLEDKQDLQDAVVFLRGNPRRPGDVVPRRFLQCLAGEDAPPFTRGSGRMELAQAIASKDNRLTARVYVNRVWGHLFGAGLVTTPSDFGTRSIPPAQAEVLDYLAVRFVDQGWSTKQLIREIVTSSIYRQSSDLRPEMTELDPDNRYFWRMNRKRLDFESMRDSILSVSGQLDTTIGGPSVEIAGGSPSPRRTLYGFIDRQNLPSLFRTFDFASPDTHAPQRYETTVPQQGLFLMNSPFLMQQADHLAQSLELSPGEISADRIAALFQRVLQRMPTKAELAAGTKFLQDSRHPDSTAGPVWQYGYGTFDPQTGIAFHRLPFATATAWQGGEELPDPQLGWVTLSAEGGHPGNDQQHAAIRRWTAPSEMDVQIRVVLKHSSDQGDGVRLRIVSGGQRPVAELLAQNGDANASVDRHHVAAGETIDFVVDCREHSSFDSFRCQVTIRSVGEEASGRWQSQEDFRVKIPTPLPAWQQLAQVLMLTNEFMFVD